MNQIKLNDFDLLVSKFKDKSGLITATVISKKGIARSETPQYRRDLLQMAVTQGHAWSNGKHPNHNKYGIYFNDKNRSEVVVERTFDTFVLNQANIIDLPPRRLKIGLNTDQKMEHSQGRLDRCLSTFMRLSDRRKDKSQTIIRMVLPQY